MAIDSKMMNNVDETVMTSHHTYYVSFISYDETRTSKLKRFTFGEFDITLINITMNDTEKKTI